MIFAVLLTIAMRCFALFACFQILHEIWSFVWSFACHYRCQILRQKTPNSISVGTLPQTPLASLQHFPDPLARFKGPTSKGGDGKGTGSGGEWKCEGRKEKGMGGEEKEWKKWRGPPMVGSHPPCSKSLKIHLFIYLLIKNL